MEQTDTLTKIIFLVLFLGVLLLAMVVIIGALNQGNKQTGSTISGTSTNETVNNLLLSPGYVAVGNVTNVQCTVQAVYNQGILIPSSNYSVNNCQITYTG